MIFIFHPDSFPGSRMTHELSQVAVLMKEAWQQSDERTDERPENKDLIVCARN